MFRYITGFRRFSGGGGAHNKSENNKIIGNYNSLKKKNSRQIGMRENVEKMKNVNLEFL